MHAATTGDLVEDLRHETSDAAYVIGILLSTVNHVIHSTVNLVIVNHSIQSIQILLSY